MENEGRLKISSLSGSGSVLLGGKTLTLTNASGTFSGGLSGTGGLTLTAGKEVLSGNSTYTGPTTINGGTLSVNGSIVSPVTVNSGGTLRGTGTIGGSVSVASGGTLAPGNSPGTLTVTVPVTLASGSTTQFDIDGAGTGAGAGNFSRLIITGAGNSLAAGGTLVPLLRGITGSATNSFTPSIGQRFEVINAQGGVQGSFSGLTEPAGLAANTRFDALYGSNFVDLLVTPASYASFAGGGSAAAVGSGLDGGRPAPGVRMTDGQAAIYGPLYALGASQILPTLQQLAPVIYDDTLMVNRSTFQMVSSAINSELQARRGAPAATRTDNAEGPGGTTIWLAGIGQFLNLNNASDSTPGYSASSGGVVAGIDGLVLPELRAGAAIGFNSQYISANNASNYSGQSLQVQLYASYQRGIGFVDAQAGAVFTEGTAHRTLSAYGTTANGDVSGNGGGGSVRGGVRVDAAGWNFEPSVMLSGLALGQGSLAESGAGPVGMQVSRNSISSLQSLIGVQADRRFQLDETYAVVPSLQVGWAYEMLDTRAKLNASFLGATGTNFIVANPSIGRSAAVIGAHAILETGTAWQAFLGYDAAFDSKANAQTVSAGIRYTW